MVAPTFSKNMLSTIENRSDEEKSANGKSVKQETSSVATRKRIGQDISREEPPKTGILCISPKCGNYVEHWIDESLYGVYTTYKDFEKEYFNKLQYLKSPTHLEMNPLRSLHVGNMKSKVDVRNG